MRRKTIALLLSMLIVFMMMPSMASAGTDSTQNIKIYVFKDTDVNTFRVDFMYSNGNVNEVASSEMIYLKYDASTLTLVNKSNKTTEVSAVNYSTNIAESVVDNVYHSGAEVRLYTKKENSTGYICWKVSELTKANREKLSGLTRLGSIYFTSTESFNSFVGNTPSKSITNYISVVTGDEIASKAFASCSVQTVTYNKSTKKYTNYFFEPNAKTASGNKTISSGNVEVRALDEIAVIGTLLSWDGLDNAVFRYYGNNVSDVEIRADMKLASPTKGSECSVNKGIPNLVSDSKYSQTFTAYIPAGATYKLAIYKPANPNKYVVKIIEVDSSHQTLGNQQLWLYGDVNCDGKVNHKDATLILKYYVGISTDVYADEDTLDERLICGDVNSDGKNNNKDATQILKYYVGSSGTKFDTL